MQSELNENATPRLDLQMIPQDVPKILNVANLDFDETGGHQSNFQQEPGAIKQEDSDSEYLWTKMQEQHIDLAGSSFDSEDEYLVPHVKKKPRRLSVTFNDKGDRVVEILDSGDEGFILPMKQEPAESRLNPRSMPSEPIVLSDDEKEVVAFEGDKVPAIKQEPLGEDSRCAETAKMINLLSSDEEDTSAMRTHSGPISCQSLLKRSNAHEKGRRAFNPQRMRQLQQHWATKALEDRQRSVPGAAGISSLPGLSRGRTNHQDITSSDNNAWMHSVYNDNSDVVSNFTEIKRQYKAKRKAKTDTIEDGIRFKKAQDTEKARLTRLQAKMYEMNTSDEDEAQQSDGEIFVPDGTPPVPSFKRRSAEEGDDEREPPGSSKSKRRKNSEKPARTKAELRSELYHNLMAGYEEEAAKDQKKAEHEAMHADKVTKRNDREKKEKRNSKNPNAKHTHELLKGKKPGGRSKTKSNTKSKRKPAPLRNLKTTDIYKESNANLAKLSMPAMSGKEKKKAMTNLIASIPLEASKIAEARGDKASILKATTILGNCKVNENRKDGEGDWTLKGLKTPLFHHQVLGAAKMKRRECGESPPQGGILADEMGHGKTLSAIAAMISNPPGPGEKQGCTLIICNSGLLSQWDNEIERHTKPGALGAIIRHNQSTRVSSKGASGRGAVSLIERSGVVLSTYSEVVKSYPKCDIPEHLTTPTEKMAWWKREWEMERGILHRVQFFRVIIDGNFSSLLYIELLLTMARISNYQELSILHFHRMPRTHGKASMGYIRNTDSKFSR